MTCLMMVRPPNVTFADLHAWTGFRGNGSSTSSVKGLPINWSASANIAWTASLNGTGQSSPVIWDNKVFTTSIEGESKEKLHVYCFGLNTGESLWRKTFSSSFPEAVTDYISRAAPTPAVDATRLYVLFESGDLITLDHEGGVLWSRKLTDDFGKLEGRHGQGASPVLTANGVVVLMDHQGASWIASFDKRNGDTLWKTDRDTSTSWSSPLVIHRKEKESIVCSASGSVTGYDAATGELQWTYADVKGNTVPSPSFSGDRIVIGGGDRKANLLLKLSDSEEPKTPSVAWRADEVVSNFGSPLIHDGRVYFVNRAGVLFCYSLESGELLFDHRLPDSVWASPLGIEDQVWFFCLNGAVVVLEAADTAKGLAENNLELAESERLYGYAVVPETFIVRTESRLIAVRE